MTVTRIGVLLGRARELGRRDRVPPAGEWVAYFEEKAAVFDAVAAEEPGNVDAVVLAGKARADAEVWRSRAARTAG